LRATASNLYKDRKESIGQGLACQLPTGNPPVDVTPPVLALPNTLQPPQKIKVEDPMESSSETIDVKVRDSPSRTSESSSERYEIVDQPASMTPVTTAERPHQNSTPY